MAVYKYTCRICNTEDNHPTYLGREMMFGTREEFEYFQCNACDCLQIANIPTDLSKFYPSTYYSLNIETDLPKEKSALRKFLERLRVSSSLFGRGFKFAKIASYLVEFPPQLHTIGPWLGKCNIQTFNAKFLDVGCGSSSSWLNNLKALGFRNLLGVDPYIKNDIKSGGILIQKTDIQNISDKFDLVTLHHSLEHIQNQIETLRAIDSVLKPDGFCLIRIPIVPSLVWEEYGTNWVEFDPPRHLYLHSLKSLKLLASKAGLEIFDIQHDTTAFEFYGSEMYARGIPLTDNNSPWINKNSSLFTNEEMGSFKILANKVNQTERAGRACIFLRKAIKSSNEART